MRLLLKLIGLVTLLGLAAVVLVLTRFFLWLAGLAPYPDWPAS